MLLLTTALFFTGTTLRWDQEGYEVLAHVEEVRGLVGWMGGVEREVFGKHPWK